MSKNYLQAALVVFLLLPVQSSLAAPKGERVLEEVLVTANKREQNLQDIATTVSVVDAGTLQDLSISEFKDIESITAGVTLEPYGPNPGIAIRGAGRQGGPDPAVVVTVDGNIQVNPSPLFTTMLDVQQIEIIRGPQGTLYGKNAPVGAFNVTTIKPDFDGVHGSVEATLDNFSTKLLRTGVNVPLIDDKLAMRVAALYEDSDGFIDFKNPGGKGHSNNGGRTDAARVRFLGFLSDKLTMDLVLNYSEEDKGYTEGASNDGNPFDYEFNTDQDNFLDTQNESASLRLDYEREGYTITLVTAYQEYSRNISRDSAGDGGATVNTFDIDFQVGRSINQELRFASNTDGPWEYLGGLFHATEDSFADVDVNNGVALIVATREAESWGIFANSTYRFSEQFAVTAGLRYSDDNKHLKDTTTTGLGAEDTDLTENFYNTSGSLKFQYTPNDHHNYYLSLDTAFRAGDFNPFMTQDFVDGGFKILDQEDSSAIELGFKGELLDGRVRVGAALFYQIYKDMQVTDPAGSPLGARVVGPDFICGFVPGGLDNGSGACVIFQNQSFPQNIEEAVSQGAEFEFDTVLADNWALSGAISYIDIELHGANGLACKSATNANSGDEPGRDYDPDFPPKVDGQDAPVCDLGDTRLRGEPHWSTTLRTEYKDDFMLGELPLEYFGRAVLKHNSERGVRRLGERTTLDLTVGIADRQASGWDFSFWVKNALDKDYARSFGTTIGVGEPRRIGVTLRKRFD